MKKLDKPDRAALEQSVKNTKKAMKSKDSSQIVTACDELSSVLREMEQKVPFDK